MTGKEKETIIKLRMDNYSVQAIARVTGYSIPTVKTFCRNNNVYPSNDPKNELENKRLVNCKYCGKIMVQKTKTPKHFCSNKCRIYAWREAKERDK